MRPKHEPSAWRREGRAVSMVAGTAGVMALRLQEASGVVGWEGSREERRGWTVQGPQGCSQELGFYCNFPGIPQKGCRWGEENSLLTLTFHILLPALWGMGGWESGARKEEQVGGPGSSGESWPRPRLACGYGREETRVHSRCVLAGEPTACIGELDLSHWVPGSYLRRLLSFQSENLDGYSDPLCGESWGSMAGDSRGPFCTCRI